MTEEQIKSKAKEQFPNDEFKQWIEIDAINWATKELQKENANLKDVIEGYKKIVKWCDKCDKIAELKKKLKEELKTIADKDLSFVARFDALEKENAELKTNYEVLSCSVGDFGELQEKLEEEQRKNNGLSDNLTKAKEIIKYLLSFIQKENYKTRWDINITEAEQFLKDSEVEE